MTSSIERPIGLRGPSRAGFTIVEIVVAMVILTVGVLGLAGTTMYVVRATTYGDLTTERSAALQSVVERLRSVEYDSVLASSDSIGSFAVSWTVQTASRSKLVRIITTGPGLKTSASGPPLIRPSVADTFEYRIMR